MIPEVSDLLASSLQCDGRRMGELAADRPTQDEVRPMCGCTRCVDLVDVPRGQLFHGVGLRLSAHDMRVLQAVDWPIDDVGGKTAIEPRQPAGGWKQNSGGCEPSARRGIKTSSTARRSWSVPRQSARESDRRKSSPTRFLCRYVHAIARRLWSRSGVAAQIEERIGGTDPLHTNTCANTSRHRALNIGGRFHELPDRG